MGVWKHINDAAPSATTGTPVGQPDAGMDIVFNFSRLITHQGGRCDVRAGRLVGPGTVSNGDASQAYSRIAGLRGRELVEHGEAMSKFMRTGMDVAIILLSSHRIVAGQIKTFVLILTKNHTMVSSTWYGI